MMMLSLTAPQGSDLSARHDAGAHSATGFWALTIGSIGVVYGDIGTSPLYAFREAIVAATSGGEVTRTAVLGVLSPIFWALIVIVPLDYGLFRLRAYNKAQCSAPTSRA